VVPPAFILVCALTGEPGSLTAAPKQARLCESDDRQGGLIVRHTKTGVDFAAWLPASHRPVGR